VPTGVSVEQDARTDGAAVRGVPFQVFRWVVFFDALPQTMIASGSGCRIRLLLRFSARCSWGVSLGWGRELSKRLLHTPSTNCSRSCFSPESLVSYSIASLYLLNEGSCPGASDEYNPVEQRFEDVSREWWPAKQVLSAFRLSFMMNSTD